MNAQIITDSRYSTAHFIAPSPFGYIHVGAQVSPPARPGPILRRGPEKVRLENRLKGLARQLEQADRVEKVTVYDAVAIPPLERLPEVKERVGSIEIPRFDVALLVETSSPSDIPEVQATAQYQALIDELQVAAKRTHVTTARNAKRLADVDKTRQGTFIFNHFIADDPEVMLDLFDYLAGWYEAETGVDNSTLLVPLEGEKSDYIAINHARWDTSPARLAMQQFAKKSFRSYVLANLKANHVGAMPVLYRLA
jgi:hypothetical protein